MEWIINVFMSFVEFITNAIRWMSDHYIATIIIIAIAILLTFILKKTIKK